MGPGDLRRFHDDAFIGVEKHLNGKCFVPLEWCTPRNIQILVDGGTSDQWSYQVLIELSEPVDETR